MCCQRPYFHPPHFGFDPVFAQTQNDGYQEAADTKQFFFQALTSSTTSSHGHFEPVWALLISSFLFIFHSYSSFHFSCAHLCSILFFTKHYQPLSSNPPCVTHNKNKSRERRVLTSELVNRMWQVTELIIKTYLLFKSLNYYTVQ